ncbi:hypothetical protein EJ08DRAFT_657550 [Tothia fuscella]|uniref:Uncharacterized protein n=1 Tax=Tothia fuscella TaxID=1048955 RepID=A0A9P4U163_9PEZI|nr:hypothetical protein EJ08DRAFT_657550 [Tothia fuscella]
MSDRDSDYWALSGVQSAIASLKFHSLSQVRLYVHAARSLSPQSVSSYLVHLLSYARYSLCTDPRDKVYGLLGIAEPDALSTITIDYSKSVQEVYTRAIMYLIMREGFQILSLQGIWPLREEWPSWVVNFQKPSPQNYMPLIHARDAPGSKYCAMPYTGTETLARFLPGGTFQVNGLLIDTVVDAVHTWKEGEWHGSLGQYELRLSGDAFRMFLKAGAPCGICTRMGERCSHLAYSPVQSSWRSSLADAVLRTLIGDYVDPTRRYVSRPPGLTSQIALRILRHILKDITEEPSLSAILSIEHIDHEAGEDTFDSVESQVLLKVLLEKLFRGLEGKRAFRTKKGWIGIGPYETRKGDCVVAVVGVDVPFVLRRLGVGSFTLVGECFVDGIIFGEILKDPMRRAGGDMRRAVELDVFDIG